MKKIIVFGGGQVGSSVAKILSDDGNDITLGDKCNIRQSTPPEYKCMTKTKSGVARWGKCPTNTQICKEDEYM